MPLHHVPYFVAYLLLIPHITVASEKRDNSTSDTRVIFSRVLPEGTSKLTVSEDGVVRISETVNGKLLRQFSLNTPFYLRPSIDLTHDGRTLAVANKSGVKFWDVQAGKVTTKTVSFGGTRCTSQVVFSPDDKCLAVVHFVPQTGSSLPIGLPHQIRLFDVASGKPLYASRWFPGRRNPSSLISSDTVFRDLQVWVIKQSLLSDADKGKELNRLVKNGMTQEEVRSILGDAEEGWGHGFAETTTITNFYWKYNISIVFDYQGKVICQE